MAEVKDFVMVCDIDTDGAVNSYTMLFADCTAGIHACAYQRMSKADDARSMLLAFCYIDEELDTAAH
jgi:hypothetical protein